MVGHLVRLAPRWTKPGDSIADWYAALLRDGSAMHEFSQDYLLAVLPTDLNGFDVLDVGCGEGIMTRALAVRGADVIGIDPTAALLAHARSAEKSQPTGATYRQDGGMTLHETTPGIEG